MIYSSIPIKIQLSRMKMIFVLLISIIFFYSCEEEVEIIENCGHMILLEEADKSLAILKKFIRKNHPIKQV